MHFIHTTQTLRLLLICGLAIALLPSNGLRAAGQIGNGTPGSCTEAVLRSAIASGGGISFNCGAGMATITLTSTLAVSENATIDGGGPNQGGRVTLSGGGQTTIMSIEPGVTLTLSNLTIRDGRDVSPDPMNQFGGVGVGSGATLAVNNSRFLNNDGVPGGTERGGGAISTAPDSTVIVRDSEFSGNHGVNGGAINMLLSSLTVENSTFTNNDSLVAAYNIPDYVTGYGGAIYVDGASPHGGTGGELIVRNSSFINNKARDQGGAILSFVYNGDSTTIEGSTFTGNRAGSAQQVGIGGALRHGNGPLTIRDSTFADNTVYGDGGAIWAGATTPGIFSNLTITNNRAEAAPNHRSFGGAFYITEGTYSITNSTIAGNFADQSGGAIIGGSSPIALNNTIIVNNTTAIDSGYARQCAASFSGGNNLQWPPFDLDFSGCGDGTIVGNPLLAVLGPNGGGSATMALGIGSPAINAGNPATCTDTDQRGADRVGTCDIGAFEYGGTPSSTPFPATPSLNPINNGGSPLFSIAWSRSSRTTYYELEIAPQPTTSAPTRLVSTSSTSLAYALDKGSYSVRVRACNSTGCSGYSNVQDFSVTSSPKNVYLPLSVK